MPGRRLLEIVLFGVALVAMICRQRLSLTLNGQWDEYNFLRYVHENLRHEVTEGFQTFHVHLFPWLARIDGIELDQVIAGRQAMFLVQLVCAIAVWRVGARLLTSSAGLFAVIAMCSFSFVLQYGTSFRYDPLLSAVFLVAGWLLVTTGNRRRAAALAGALFGLGLAISVKAAFFGPSLCLLALVRSDDERRLDVRALAWLVAASALSFAALYGLHRSTLAPSDADPVAWANATATAMLAPEGRLFPRFREISTSLRWDVVVWLLLGVGLLIAAARVALGRGRRNALLVLAFAAPMASIIVYRNAWPYYFATVLPGASLLCGLIVAELERARQGARGRAALAVVLVLVALVVRDLALWSARNGEEQNEVQRALLEGVHEMFPEPVPYADRCGMVSSFPKVGPFMSGLSMGQYRATKRSVVDQILAKAAPVFVLANVRPFELERDVNPRRAHRIPRADFEWLQGNYVRHWGPVWVAGKELVPPGPIVFDLVLAGPYTVEGPEPIELDGEIRGDGDVVTLGVGMHTAVLRGTEPARLRFGDHLHRPTQEPPRGDVFSGLSFKTE